MMNDMENEIIAIINAVNKATIIINEEDFKIAKLRRAIEEICNTSEIDRIVVMEKINDNSKEIELAMKYILHSTTFSPEESIEYSISIDEINQLRIQAPQLIDGLPFHLDFKEFPNFIQNILGGFDFERIYCTPIVINGDFVAIITYGKQYGKLFSPTESELLNLFAQNILNVYKHKSDLEQFQKTDIYYNHFMDNSNDGLLITENYKYVRSNPKFKEIFDVKDDSYFDGNLADWGVIDLLDVDNFVKFHKRKDNKLYEMESWIQRNGNEKRYIRKKFFDYRSEQTALNFLIINDITEQKIAEIKLKDTQERFRLISELTTDCSYSFLMDIDFNLYFEWCSGSYKDLFGIPNELTKFKTMWDNNICADFVPALEMRMQNLRMGRKDITEYQVKDKNGNLRWIRDYAVPVFDNYENRVIRIIGAASDISEQKIATAEILRTTDELKNLNISKDKFFSIVSHDMRNPIMGFKNLTELLDEEFDDMDTDEIRDIIKAMKQSAISLHTMFEDLVQWSKSQMGRINFDPQLNNVYSVVAEVINSTKTALKAKNIKIVNHLKLNCEAFFDSKMIKLVLRNLITNAIKFSYTDSEIHIICNCNSVMNNLPAIEIEIKDFGIGIEQKNISKLFKLDDYYIANGTANEKGSGLGLLLCKEFIQKHKGSIWVDSSLGNGSSFKFMIPRFPV